MYLAVALFVKTKFLETSRLNLLFIQSLGVITYFVWSFGTSWLVFKFLDDLYSLRVSFEEEGKGLNISEHNIEIDNNY